MAARRYKISLLVLKMGFTRLLLSLMITTKKKFRISAQPFNILNLFHFDPDVRN